MIIEKFAYGYRKHDDLVRLHIGPGFSFWQNLRMGGSGSERAQVVAATGELKAFHQLSRAITYANIELRPGGIMVILSKDIRRIAWLVRFPQLQTAWDHDFELRDGEHALTLQLTQAGQAKFAQKLLSLQQASMRRRG